MGLAWGAAAMALSLFFSGVGAVGAVGGVLAALTSLRGSIKDMTTTEQADVLMLKTLEHYGLIRLLDNNQIQLVND